MAANFFGIKLGVNISPSTTAASAAGDIRFDSASNNDLKFYDGTTEHTVVTLVGTQTLTNKSLTAPTLTGAISVSGAITSTNTTASSSASTGALVLSGANAGLGVNGQIFSGDSMTAPIFRAKQSGDGQVIITSTAASGKDWILESSGTAGHGAVGVFTIWCPSFAGSNISIDGSSGYVTLSAAAVSNVTASQAIFTNASKQLVSNAITGSGNVVMSTSPVLVTPDLGTPSALVGTNITGTASGLTAGHVTTLQLPGAATLGGVFSKAVVSHQFLTGISSVDGSVGQAQPAFTDISGSVAAGQMPALTGDVTTSAGAVATTLATVNSNVGSFGSASAIPSITVNAKGLVTAASSNALKVPTFTQITAQGTQVGWLFTISTTATVAVGDTYTNNAHTFTVQIALTAQSGTVLFMSGTGTTTGTSLVRATGSGTDPITFSAKVATALYTAPTSPAPLYFELEATGPGGGGGGSGTAAQGAGSTGLTAYFGLFATLASGVGAGGGNAAGGAGGAATKGNGAIGATYTGGPGQGSGFGPSATAMCWGGAQGGANFFGGAGGGGGPSLTGIAGATNTGAGGGGGGTANGSSQIAPGSGGGAGGACKLVLPFVATIPYVFTTGGGAGGAGTSGFTGGAGADSLFNIWEKYQ